MRPLICPQCGGQITSYLPGQVFTTCQYCSTKFLIEENKQKRPEPVEPSYTPPPAMVEKSPMFIGVLSAVMVVFGIVFVIAIISKTGKQTVEPRPSLFTASPSPTKPIATPDPNLLVFGGEGTGNGLFQDADSIDVDKQGRIYVSDGSLRVQQFDDKGQFIKVWQVPSATDYYARARQINKIAVGDDGRIYVAVGGVVLVYTEESTEPVRTIHVAPDYIQDFALRSDGGVLLVSNDERIETLHIMNKAGKVLRRVKGFHTYAADAELSPPVTAMLGIRVATDGAGNIYSIYGMGDIGTYELNYNSGELMILRFTPDVKYVDRFVETLHSCGIEVDDQSRVYISNRYSIEAYSNQGETVSVIPDIGLVNAFALDKENNVYALVDNKVIKRSAVQ